MKKSIVVGVLLGFALFTGSAALAAANGPRAVETPAVFLHRVFTKYRSMENWPRNYNPCHEFCEAGLAKLVDGARVGEDGPLVDYDPFCQCQDGGGIFAVVSGKWVGTREYQAQVRDTGPLHYGKGVNWAFVVRRMDGHWKIYDVIENGVSLRQRLSK